MNKSLVAVAVLISLGLAGCSTTGGNKVAEVQPTNDATTAIEDRTLSSEWRDEGVKISYTLSGKIKKIEVYERVPAFTADYRTVAALRAKAKAINYIYGEDVNIVKKLRTIGSTIKRDRDNTLNRFKSNDGTVDAKLVEQADALAQAGGVAGVLPVNAPDGAQSVEQLTPQRSESTANANTLNRNTLANLEVSVDTIIKSRSGGRLLGWRVSGYPDDNGKVWVAKLEWTPDDIPEINRVRSLNMGGNR